MLGAASHFGHLLCMAALSSVSWRINNNGRSARERPKIYAKRAEHRGLGSRDIAYGDLARATIFLRVKRDLLPFVQSRQSCTLEGGRMNEDVLAAILRLDETEALLVIVEFYGTNLHLRFLT